MKCRKCGKEIVGDDFKKVADWIFCNECFESLMTESDSDKEEVLDNTEDKDEPDRDISCQICGCKLSDTDTKRLLGLVLCRGCYDALLERPSTSFAGEDSDETDNGSDEEDAGDKFKVDQVEVPLNRFIRCFGCGRNIPVGGSKVIDGHRYCPDCFKRLSVDSDVKDVGNVGDRSTDRMITCQSCGRRVDAGHIKNVDGFDICLACLSSDPEIAVSIARQRHRDLLRQIRSTMKDR